MISGIIMMSRTSIFVIFIACIIAGLLVAGCTQSQTPAAAGTAGMANPASVNCGKIGGATEIKTAADGGQYGMCTFPNGTSCEEWALFRNEGCKTNVTLQATTPVTTASAPTTAAVNASK
jgi:uncharacterized protein